MDRAEPPALAREGHMGWKKPFGSLGRKGPAERKKEFPQREEGETLHAAPEKKIEKVSALVWVAGTSSQEVSQPSHLAVLGTALDL